MTHKSARLDRELAERLNNLYAQNDRLTAARGAYLFKKSQQETFESRLIESAVGKSVAERTVKAKATQEWLDFQTELSTLFNLYEHEKQVYDILDKAYLAEHLSAKLDADTIKRSVG